MFGTDKLPIKTHKYNCGPCCFTTDNKKDYNRHILTRKHEMEHPGNNITHQEYPCDKCSKDFKTKSGLWKHVKKCNYIANPENEDPQISNSTIQDDPSIIVELLKQNQEFKNLIVEERREFQDMMIKQNETITELAKNAGNVTNNNTTNNKFNLNVFLNETCKDAITMNDFINSIEVTMEDFINTGKIGFVDGISKVMVERMKDMEMHTRPMHCTDLKRETMYIKNNDTWEKEDTEKTTLRKAVKRVAKKNYRQLKPWFDSSQPEVEQLGTDECENYFKYYKAALGGYGKEEDKIFEDKIMRNVLREVVVDK